MSYFSEDALQMLADTFGSVPRRVMAITEAFMTRRYASDLGREHAHHGVCRRLSTVERCIDQTFRLVPPEIEAKPDRDALMDATIFMQAFVFNAYGVLDNLAAIWVNEKNVTNRKGELLPNQQIVLSKSDGPLRASFSQEMQGYLAGREPWFTYMENYRHALGHRIPLYIPPYTVSPENIPAYEGLGARMHAAWERRDFVERDQLKAEQDALTLFRPFMKHSFEDPMPPVPFHAQVLADFETLEEMTFKVLAELDR